MGRRPLYICECNLQELEEEILALEKGRKERARLKELMLKKELVGDVFNNLRLTRQRYCASEPLEVPQNGQAALQGVNDTLAQLLMVMERLDNVIGKAHVIICLNCCCC